jgi:hypothetical protein
MFGVPCPSFVCYVLERAFCGVLGVQRGLGTGVGLLGVFGQGAQLSVSVSLSRGLLDDKGVGVYVLWLSLLGRFAVFPSSSYDPKLHHSSYDFKFHHWLIVGRVLGQANVATKAKLTKAMEKKYVKKFGGSSGATSGLSSSLAFTPIQVRPTSLPAL